MYNKGEWPIRAPENGQEPAESENFLPNPGSHLNPPSYGSINA